jgi:hypothetical protein
MPPIGIVHESLTFTKKYGVKTMLMAPPHAPRRQSFTRQTVPELVDALQQNGRHPHDRDVVPVEEIRQRAIESLRLREKNRRTSRDDRPRDPERLLRPNPPEWLRIFPKIRSGSNSDLR